MTYYRFSGNPAGGKNRDGQLCVEFNSAKIRTILNTFRFRLLNLSNGPSKN